MVSKDAKAEFKAIILTADEFEDMELFFPWFRLLEEGIEVDVTNGPSRLNDGDDEAGQTVRGVD